LNEFLQSKQRKLAQQALAYTAAAFALVQGIAGKIVCAWEFGAKAASK
jgi:hypothetical protein